MTREATTRLDPREDREGRSPRAELFVSISVIATLSQGWPRTINGLSEGKERERKKKRTSFSWMEHGKKQWRELERRTGKSVGENPRNYGQCRILVVRRQNCSPRVSSVLYGSSKWRRWVREVQVETSALRARVFMCFRSVAKNRRDSVSTLLSRIKRRVILLSLVFISCRRLLHTRGSVEQLSLSLDGSHMFDRYRKVSHK